MSSMRNASILAIAAATALLGGCSSTGTGAQGTTGAAGSPGSASLAATTPISSRRPASPPASQRLTLRQDCQRALGAAVLLDWTGGTVADFRVFQYGGPTPIRPLAHVFPGVPGSTLGAWCGTRQGPETTRWWVAIPGHKPARAIDITGPGEGVRHGYVSTPPRIP